MCPRRGVLADDQPRRNGVAALLCHRAGAEARIAEQGSRRRLGLAHHIGDGDSGNWFVRGVSGEVEGINFVDIGEPISVRVKTFNCGKIFPIVFPGGAIGVARTVHIGITVGVANLATVNA